MNTIIAMHPEDVKAGLRKRFGTIAAFERVKGLPEKSVNDVMRGRPSARVLKAVVDALNTPAPPASESEFSDNSENTGTSHRIKSRTR